MIIRLRRPGDLHGGGYGGCPGRRHVAGTSPKPTGTVKFKDGATVLGTSTVANNGRATYGTAALGWSHHNVTTYYSGDTEYGAAISPVLDQNVRANTSVTTGSSLNPSVYSQSVTFTSHVTAVAPGTGTPTGSVAYWVDTNYVQTATVNASGDATYTTSSLSGGVHTNLAYYAGDDRFGPSSVSVTQTVNKANTAAALISSLNPSTASQSVTFTATVSAVSPGSGVPTGSVTFKDGTATLATKALDSTGKATYSTSTLSKASHSITAVYAGDTNYISRTSILTRSAPESWSAIRPCGLVCWMRWDRSAVPRQKQLPPEQFRPAAVSAASEALAQAITGQWDGRSPAPLFEVSPTLTDLPPLEYHQTKRVDHRLFLRRH